MPREYAVQYTGFRLGFRALRVTQPGDREYAERGARNTRVWQRQRDLPADAAVVVRDGPRDAWRPVVRRRRARR